MRASRTYGSVRGARHETRVPTATDGGASSSRCSAARRRHGRSRRGRSNRQNSIASFRASTEAQPDPFVEGFRDGLRERGYVEGRNLVLELRYSPGKTPDALRAAISELTRRNWDLAVEAVRPSAP